MAAEIYVGGIPAGNGEAEVRRVLEIFGPLLTITVKQAKSPRTDCFGFVSFARPGDAQRAVEAGAGKAVKLDGKALTVRWSQNKGFPGAAVSSIASAASASHAAPPTQPGPNTRGWQCRDPSCAMWNEDVSPLCVQCHLPHVVRQAGFGSWEQQVTPANISLGPAPSAALSRQTMPSNDRSFGGEAASRSPVAVDSVTKQLRGSTLAHGSATPSSSDEVSLQDFQPRGRGQRAKLRQQQQLVGLRAPSSAVMAPLRRPEEPKDESTSVESLHEENLRNELRMVKARCQMLDKELQSIRRKAKSESDVAAVLRLRRHLDQKRTEAASLNPSLVVECVNSLLQASDSCVKSQPKVYDQVRKGINYYRSFSGECEEEAEAEMNRLARESAAKALSVSLAQYLSLFPYEEIAKVSQRAEKMGTRLLQEKPWLSSVGPKPLGQDHAATLDRLKRSEKFCSDEIEATDLAYAELCQEVERLSGSLQGAWAERFDPRPMETAAAKAREAMQREEASWKRVKLDSVQSERLKELYGHLAWSRQRLSQILLQYRDVYDLTRKLEGDHGLTIIDNDVMADPDKRGMNDDPDKHGPDDEPDVMVEEEARVVVPPDDEAFETKEGGGAGEEGHISEDDHLSDVLTFSDEEAAGSSLGRAHI